jgi:hypothetical protein
VNERPERLHRATLLIALGVFLVGSLAMLVGLPVHEGPDEPGHLDYAFRIASTGERPYLQGEAALAGATVWDESSMGHHPQLYYRVLAWTAALSGSQVPAVTFDQVPNRTRADGTFAANTWRHGFDEVAPRSAEVRTVWLLRGVSVVCGLVSLVLVFATARVLVPNRPAVASIAVLLLAALPQWQGSHAVLDNGALSTTLSFAALYVLARLWTRAVDGRADDRSAPTAPVTWTEAVVLGLLVGAALETKLTALFLLPVALVVAVGAIWRARDRRLATLARCAVAVAIVAALFAPFVLENLARYGELLGTQAHRRAYAQSLLATALPDPEWQSQYLWGVHAQSLFPTLGRTLVGHWGWNALAAPLSALVLFGTAAGSGFVGLVVAVIGSVRTRGGGPNGERGLPWRALALPAGVALLVLVQVVLYNRTFMQPQGRYLFPGLGAAVVLVAAGLATLGAPLPRTLARLVGTALGAAVVVVSLRIAVLDVPRHFAFDAVDDPLFASVAAQLAHPVAADDARGGAGEGEGRVERVQLVGPDDGSVHDLPPTLEWTAPADSTDPVVWTVNLWRADGTYLGGTFERLRLMLTDTRWSMPQDYWTALEPGTVLLWQVRAVPDRRANEAVAAMPRSAVRRLVRR